MSALLMEVADLLLLHSDLKCVPMVDVIEDAAGNECYSLQVTFSATDQPTVGGAMDALDLYHGLQRLADVASLRALCAKYGLNAAELEARLAPKEDQ